MTENLGNQSINIYKTILLFITYSGHDFQKHWFLGGEYQRKTLTKDSSFKWEGHDREWILRRARQEMPSDSAALAHEADSPQAYKCCG